MPEIELGACPDVAGTYDLARLGILGRAMAIAGLDLNGNEAKAYGLADHLVLGSRMEHLKEMLLDAVVEGQEDNSVEAVLKDFAIEPEAPRHSKEDYDALFGSSLSLAQVIEQVKKGKDQEGSLAARAYEKMSKASTYGIILSDVMNKEGQHLELKQARALEYLVWNNMDKDDFKESIHSRFILPRKERHAPRFTHPLIFEMSSEALDSLREDIQHMVDSLKPKIEGTEQLLFSTLEQ